MTAASRGQKTAFPTATSTVAELPVGPSGQSSARPRPSPPAPPNAPQRRPDATERATLTRASRGRPEFARLTSRGRRGVTGRAGCGATVLALNYRA